MGCGASAALGAPLGDSSPPVESSPPVQAEDGWGPAVSPEPEAAKDKADDKADATDKVVEATAEADKTVDLKPAEPKVGEPADASLDPRMSAEASWRMTDMEDHAVEDEEQEVAALKANKTTAYAAFIGAGSPMDRYMYLRGLQAQDADLFFDLLSEKTEEILPYIYTPTVGEACQRYHELPGLETRGLYITLEDKGSIADRLAGWPEQDIDVIVVTDGERILGLGDQGAGGMGISEGKILLYTVAAGIDHRRCLPVCLDVGTNNQERIDDAAYKGLRSPRPTGVAYDAFLDEFMQAVKAWRPNVLLQFEDFGNGNAFRLLDTYRPQLCCFNDDIQGTACTTLAAVLSGIRRTKKPLAEQKFLFLGAGEAGCGIGELLSQAIADDAGIPVEDARKHCMFMDSRGMVTSARADELAHHKLPFAHELPACEGLEAAVRELRPTALIGVSTIPGAFTEGVVRAMGETNDMPIIMPLSNPTSKSECTFEQAFEWTDGALVFASGSPFAPIERDGVEHCPAQSNNAYIFPAVGHAAVLTKCREIPDSVFLAAARSLGGMTSEEALARGFLFPSFDGIRDISARVMTDVMAHIVEARLGGMPAGFSDLASAAAFATGTDGPAAPAGPAASMQMLCESMAWDRIPDC